MSTVIYTELGRRVLGGRFCELVALGESERSAAEISGVSRRTFERWCRGCPALAAEYARAVAERAAFYRRRELQLRGVLAAAERGLRGVPAGCPREQAAEAARVEAARRELADFIAAVRSVPQDIGERRRRRLARAAR